MTLPHPVFNSMVAEVVRWKDTIHNVGVQLSPIEAACHAYVTFLYIVEPLVNKR